MAGKITLIGRTNFRATASSVIMRSVTREDAEALARLYFASYEGDNLWSQADAQQEIEEILDGKLGEFCPEASPLVLDSNNRVVAAALVLKNRIDNVGPNNTPTIYQLFTAASRRREGLAEQLIRTSSSVLHDASYDEFFVHIDDGNAAALALYLTLDFNRWFPSEEDSF